MCGRYALPVPPEAIRDIFGTVNAVPEREPSWNIAPSQAALVVRRHPESGARHLSALHWGLVPHFNTDAKGGRKPINARGETVATSPMFRSAFAARRCLVPATAFYEWHAEGAGKTPHAIARVDGGVLAFAGVWEGWRAPDGGVVRSFAILTISASADVAGLHDRMPVIVGEADWPCWLGEEVGDVARLVRPAPAGLLEHWPVSRAVNAPRNDGPKLLERDGLAAGIS